MKLLKGTVFYYTLFVRLSMDEQPENIGSRGKRKSSRKKPMPEILVRCESKTSRSGLAHAHLQNNGGYLYLVWRDGATIERRYLGKAPKDSTTEVPPARTRRRPRARPGPRSTGRYL